MRGTILHFKYSCYVLAIRSASTSLIATNQRAVIGVATGMTNLYGELNGGGGE